MFPIMPTEMDLMGLINFHFGEVWRPIAEDGYVGFEVYRDYYEYAPQEITDGKLTLTLADKFDEQYYTLVYKISGISPKKVLYPYLDDYCYNYWARQERRRVISLPISAKVKEMRRKLQQRQQPSPTYRFRPNSG